MSVYIDISADIKQIILEELNYGLNISRNSNLNPDVLVHEIRKCLKRIRSLFRLLKPVMSESDFHTTDEMIAEVSRALTFQRESIVNFQTFKEIEKNPALSISIENSLLISDFLNKEIQKAYSKKENAFHNKLINIAFQLSKISERISKLETRRFSYKMLLLAIEKNYNKAITYFTNARISLHGEAIHKWRRYCKHVFFQLKFGPVNKTQEVKEYIERIGSLSDLLGKEHDLSVLDKILKKEIYSKISQKERVILHQFIEKERNTYQKKAFLFGKEVFAKKSVLPLQETLWAEKIQNTEKADLLVE